MEIEVQSTLGFIKKIKDSMHLILGTFVCYRVPSDGAEEIYILKDGLIVLAPDGHVKPLSVLLHLLSGIF